LRNTDELSYEYLTKRNLVKIHDTLLSASGGASGILGEGLIDLCVESPRRIIFDHEPHKTLMEKAASLMYNIITLHPLVDGNKRTAYVATEAFLQLNGYKIKATKNEKVNITLKIAKSNMGIEELLLG